jgi:DNA-binding protein HU-beta
MTKADLIDSVAARLDLPKGQAERAVNLVFEDIVKALRNGDKVNVSGFGTFAVSERKARTGRNPKTGESIDIPASKSAKFKAGKSLKDELK